MSVLSRRLEPLRRVEALRNPGTLRRLALASLIANIGIVVTGGLVRLTGSGLGCPTWPRCTDASYVTTAEMGMHGAIEFGNRTLTFVLGLIALAGLVCAYARNDGRTLRPAVLVLAGIAFQGGLGGVTVRTGLNPWTVAAHFLVSMAIIAAAYVFWRRSRPDLDRPLWKAPRPVRALAVAVTAASALVLVVGTVVTGSGPHSGDETAGRTGLDPEMMAQLHADVVFLLVGLTVGLWFAVRSVGAPASVVRGAGVLLLVELAQGLVGLIQSLTNLPWLVVILHMLGACLVWVTTVATLASVLAGKPAPPSEPPAQARPTRTAANTIGMVSAASTANGAS